MMDMEEEDGQIQPLTNGKEDTEKTKSRVYSLLATNQRDYLLSQTGDQVKVSDLDGRIVALYFSANWYPQCRTFTQLLIPIYSQIKSQNPNFEIVFVSSDEDFEAFNAYRSQMPWLTVPFSDLETKKALNKMFDIEGIPCLVVLQPDGEGVARDGVELVFRHGVDAYPFTRVKLAELERLEREKHERQTVMSLLTHHDRDDLLAHPVPTQVGVSCLVGKTVGLYFSAEWCHPCAKFTPKLISIYHKIKQALALQNSQNALDEDFEIVLVSCDRDHQSFVSYFNTMPFLALPHGDAAIKALLRHFDVRDIPCLVILGPDGKTVTKQGRNLINYYEENAYPFTNEKIELLEREIDEAAKSLPRSVRHAGHARHELSLVSQGAGGGPFICCGCDEQGSGWAYLCLECGYEVHPRCVRDVDDRH